MERMFPTRCPACSGNLTLERLRCGGCGTAVEGAFSLDWVAALSPEQLKFVRVFLACRGKIKDVEQALGLSYPTVVSRLDDVVTAMGEAKAPPPPVPERLDVLGRLARGEIEIDEAERLLKKKGAKD